MTKKNILGLILIFTGVAWILDLSGIVHVNWAEAIKNLWPVILIAAGISMLAGRSRLVTTTVWILTFALFIGFGIYKNNENKSERIIGDETPDIKSAQVAMEPADDKIALGSETEEGKLTIELGTAIINIEDGNRNLLAEADTNIPNIQQQLADGKQAVLKYTQHEYEKSDIARNFNLRLNPAIPWEIDASLSVVDGKFDLGKIPLSLLDLKLGVGDLDLIVGKQQEHSVINIQAGATDLEIYIPKEAGLMVKSGNLLTNLKFHGIDMTSQEDVFISENYEQAECKIEMNIQSAVSTIEIFAE